MSEWSLKRFWTSESVVEVEGGYTVQLDGRGIKTPAKAALIVPTQALAQAMAAEWAAQEGEVDPGTMPYTRMANAAIDKVRVQKDEVADLLADYGDSDLLCYRATGPEALVARQAATWDPYLDWAADTLDARLSPQAGVMHKPQDPEALARLRTATHALDPFQLAAFHDLVSLTGSLILGFATCAHFQAPEQVWRASRVDEDWQAEQWGEDEEELDVTAVKQGAFLHAKAFWDCLIPDLHSK